MSNPGNIAGGHKANLNNPNTSEESKQHSKEVLDNQLNGGDISGSKDANADKNPNNVYVHDSAASSIENLTYCCF